jgi:Protein of unknown function (DUF3040)
MSLSARQQRMLDGIERVLQASEPKMASMFAIFTRLTKDEGPAMTERLRSRRLALGFSAPWLLPPRLLPPRLLPSSRNLGAFVLLPVALAMLITGILLGGPPRGCDARLTGVSLNGSSSSQAASPAYPRVCYK